MIFSLDFCFSAEMWPCDISGSQRFTSEVLRAGTQAIYLTACVALLISVVKLHLPVSLQPPDLTHVMVITENDSPNQQNNVGNSCTNVGFHPYSQRTKPNKLNKHICKKNKKSNGSDSDHFIHLPICSTERIQPPLASHSTK